MPRSNHNFHVEKNISRAWTLPANLYFDPEIYAIEKRNIFGQTWQVVGHRDQVANPGDYFTTEVIGEPLLIVRGADDKLRAFYNVCRHRAGPPAEGCGSRKLFRCGYHGWTYDLDGSLISATEIEGAADFRRQDFALVPLPVAEWFDLVFVNLNSDAADLAHSLQGLDQGVEKFPFSAMKLFARRTYEMNCNWKTYVDNYLEGYHLPSVHPGLNRELDYNAYRVELQNNSVRQFSPIRGTQPGDAAPRRYRQPGPDLTADYFWIFPNWMLNCYPDNVSLNIVLPLGPERSLAIFEWYLPEEDHATPAANASVEFSHQIQIEDIAICEVVQKNLHSRSYTRGRFSVKQEKGIHAFHRLYAAQMNQPLPRRPDKADKANKANKSK